MPAAERWRDRGAPSSAHDTIVAPMKATPTPATMSSQKWLPVAMTENQTHVGQSVQRIAAQRLLTSVAMAKPMISASAACTLGMAAYGFEAARSARCRG